MPGIDDRPKMPASTNPYWSQPVAELLNQLGSTAGGLLSTEVAARDVRPGGWLEAPDS